MNYSQKLLSALAILGMASNLSVARADLVAYWPLNDGAPGTSVTATGADDVIDDPNHGAGDAVAQGPNETWHLRAASPAPKPPSKSNQKDL